MAEYNMNRMRSNSGAVMSERLRAASKMHQEGMISSDEKAIMKSLILQQDAGFRAELERSEHTGDYSKVKDALKKGKLGAYQRTMSVDVLNDLTADVNLGEFGEDISGVFDSGFFDNPLGDPMIAHAVRAPDMLAQASATRKREASQSLPMQNRNKIMTPAVQQSYSRARPAAQAPAKPPKPISQQKVRKNERERKRRLAVSQGFEELFALLKIPETQKLDKATILKTTIEKIQLLESKIKDLEDENVKLTKSQSLKDKQKV